MGLKKVTNYPLLYPDQYVINLTVTSQGAVPKWLRERIANPRCIGSNPIGASNFGLSYRLLAKLEQSEKR